MTIWVALAFSRATPVFELDRQSQRAFEKSLKRTWPDAQVSPSATPLNEQYLGKQYLFFDINKADSLLGYALVKRAKACRAGGCSAENNNPHLADSDMAGYEYFDFVMLLNTRLEVQRIEIINYQAQYGYEICNPRWLRQFQNYQGHALRYGTDIQAISGATISAQSITDEVQLSHQAIRQALQTTPTD